MPNMLIIAGEGRNVGKTWLACRIIRQLSATEKVTAVKISSHFHGTDPRDILFEKKGRYIIHEEKNISGKDSSLMLQAGAARSFFIMAPGEYLREAFLRLRPFLEKGPVVCESGGLAEIVRPGIFLFVKRTGTPLAGMRPPPAGAVIVNGAPGSPEMSVGSYGFTGNRIIRKG